MRGEGSGELPVAGVSTVLPLLASAARSKVTGSCRRTGMVRFSPSRASGDVLRSVGPCLPSAEIPARRWSHETETGLAPSPAPAAALAPTRFPALLPADSAAVDGTPPLYPTGS